VKPTERSAQRLCPNTGCSAMLSALLDSNGTRVHSSSVPARRVALATVSAILGALAVATAPASAVVGHKFSFSFAGSGAEAGEVSAPAGVAVDSATGAIYVADSANSRVDDFNSKGEFALMFGREVNKTKVQGGVATEAEQNVCTEVEVAMGAECQAGVSGSGPGQFEHPVFVAVDNSVGGEGDVYVGDAGDNLVTKFSSEGSLVESWGVEGQLDGSTTVAGSFGSLAGVAVGTTGTLYVCDTSNQVFEFEQNATFSPPEVLASERGTEPDGLAVDPLGDLFKVNDDNSVEKLTGSGDDVGQVSPNKETGVEAVGVAVDGTDLYIAERDAVKNYAFTEPVTEPGVVSERGGSPCTVAPGSPCPATDSFGSGEPSGGSLTGGSGIGLNSSSGDVYVADATAGHIDVFIPGPNVTTHEATEVKKTSAVLNGAVDPDGVAVTDCHFDYVPQPQFEASGFEDVTAAEEAACEQTVGSGTGEVPVTARVTGLHEGTTYDLSLQAENANAVPSFGADATFTAPPPPSIDAATTANLSATSVDLEAQVNPGGREATCQFEYGTSTSYGKTVACVPQLGSGTSDVAVTGHIEGLSPNVTYHWRVVANNESGTTTGVDHTFIYPETGPGLPDNRAYEMITPVQKNGALIGSFPFSPHPAISENGSRVILGSLQCFAGAGACEVEHGSIGSLYAFERTAGSWVTTPLAPPATQFETDVFHTYDATEDTSLFSAPTPPFDEEDFYLREPGGSFVDIGPLDPPEDGLTLSTLRNFYMDEATGDFSHVVFNVDPYWPHTSGEPSGTLLEYVGTGNTAPTLVGVSGGLGSTELISSCSSTSFPGQPGGLSADGRTVYFAAKPCSGVPARELYARIDGELPDAHTVAISQPNAAQTAAESPPDGNCTEVSCIENTEAFAPPAVNPSWSAGEFAGASADGSQAFFLDTQQLTDGATQGAGSAEEDGCREGADCNLYLYDFDMPAGHNLIDVSAGDTSGGGPRVQGVMATSSDGSHVYFVARGVLTLTENLQGQGAQEGQDNLYVYERDASHPNGHVTFIATLPGKPGSGQNPVPEELQWRTELPTANVTPDGRFLVFISRGALTPDVTRTDGATQVFRYDAQTEQLVRVSIGEDGFNDDGNGGAGDASIVQAADDLTQHAGVDRTDPTMSNDGSRVFFMSSVGLMPGALNSVQTVTTEHGEPEYAQNVYEWELAGTPGGSCPEGALGGACVYLISDGHDSTAAQDELCNKYEENYRLDFSSVCLVGSDASGSNVFFTTADQLVPQDTDTQVDIYDARICEPENGNPCIQPPPRSAPPCLGEACHGVPPATPPLLTPGSASFSGAGNLAPASTPPVKPKSLTRAQRLAAALKACRKHKSKGKRAKCEKQARQRYGPSNARRTTHNKRSK